MFIKVNLRLLQQSIKQVAGFVQLFSAGVREQTALCQLQMSSNI